MSAHPRPEPDTYTVTHAAALLGIGRNTAYVLVRNGQLPALRLGRRVVIRRATIERLLRDPAALADAPAAIATIGQARAR